MTGGYIGINSFGFGGTNVHVLLRSFDQPESARQHPAAAVPRLFTCCSRTQEGAESILNAVLQRPNDIELQFLLESSVGNLPLSTHPYRGYAVVNSTNNRKIVEVSYYFRIITHSSKNLIRTLSTLQLVSTEYYTNVYS
jgi:fatty acid synthase